MISYNTQKLVTKTFVKKDVTGNTITLMAFFMLNRISTSYLDLFFFVSKIKT